MSSMSAAQKTAEPTNVSTGDGIVLAVQAHMEAGKGCGHACRIVARDTGVALFTVRSIAASLDPLYHYDSTTFSGRTTRNANA